MLLLLIASTMLLSFSSVQTLSTEDFEGKLNSYKEKFEKSGMMPGWEIKGLGYQMGVGRQPEPESKPASASEPVSVPVLAPETSAVAAAATPANRRGFAGFRLPGWK
jgi:hypothetical protein